MSKIWFFATAALIAGVVSPAQAVLVTNLTTNTVVFNDNGFEDDVVGSAQNAPTIGSWSNTINAGSTITVETASPPGAASGNNYLKTARTVTGGTNSQAIFSQVIPVGEMMRATFMYNLKDKPLTSAIFGPAGAANFASLRGYIGVADGYAAPYDTWYAVDSFTGTPHQFSGLPLPSLGNWQQVTIDYTVGSNDVKLTVDGMSETLVGAFDPTGADGPVDRLRFQTSDQQTTYYLDAVPSVPPPVLGDYNNNGKVDAADYVLWRKGGPLQNDPTPGVQPDDYAFWRANFGNPPGAGSGSGLGGAVPEPGTIGLAMLGLVLFAARRAKRGE